MKDGFVKVCAATPKITAADCPANGDAILAQIREAADKGVKIIVFPELCITGATCGDLFRSTVLLQSAMDTLLRLTKETEPLDILCAVGLPIRTGSRIFNCCALFHKGAVQSIAAKQHLSPAERRVFSCPEEPLTVWLPDPSSPDYQVAVTTELLTIPALGDAKIGVEIGSDGDLPIPPSSKMATEHGVSVILHPSAQPETVTAEDQREVFHRAHSRALCCGYITAEAGDGESTTDQVWGGQRLIAENGMILAKSDVCTTGLTISELDVDYLQQKRTRQQFPSSAKTDDTTAIPVRFDVSETKLTRPVSPSPFLPMTDPKSVAERTDRILSLQCAGLSQRLAHTRCATAVVGVSGGLDSTLALLVTARTFDQLQLPRTQIHAISMPGFGTTGRTKSNAQLLAEALGVSFREISIAKAVEQHFADIGQPLDRQDVTYENAQARERTQVLMDVANQLGGLVVGTGDLSELALGWATYNGDHMSMYSVNGSIPKTLMRHIVSAVANQSDSSLQAVLRDILDTPVSPELLPAKDGEIVQKTEELVGPYALHDFFLYHALGNGFSPEKIARLANNAFDGVYFHEEIQKWLANFYRRFFQQQFKRSCLPDGPAVGSISLSPRGGLAMPSDASGAVWQALTNQ